MAIVLIFLPKVTSFYKCLSVEDIFGAICLQYRHENHSIFLCHLFDLTIFYHNTAKFTRASAGKSPNFSFLFATGKLYCTQKRCFVLLTNNCIQ